MNTNPLPPSRYLSYFEAHAGKLRQAMKLVGDVILVERVKFPEAKSAGGIIFVDHAAKQINSTFSDRPVFYRVLLPGEGYYNDETNEPVPLDVKQGDIVLASTVGVKLFSSFPLLEAYEADTIGITREAEITWRFLGEGAFVDTLHGLNQAVKAQVVEQAG